MEPIEELRGIARSKFRNYSTKTIRLSMVDDALHEGWEVLQKNERTVRLKREKAHDVDFVDRIWSLLYRMKFLHLNNEEIAVLEVDPKDSKSQPILINIA